MTTAPDKDPAMTLGVPMYWFRINFIVFGIGLIAFLGLLPKLVFFVVVNIPLHVFGYVMTERDHHWMSVIWIKLKKCRPTRNRLFWGADSYAP